jgi:hypothetical protein
MKSSIGILSVLAGAAAVAVVLGAMFVALRGNLDRGAIYDYRTRLEHGLREADMIGGSSTPVEQRSEDREHALAEAL